MNLGMLSSTAIALIITFVVLLAAGIVIWLLARKRRTERLRLQFGNAEYSRAVKEAGSRRRAEASLAGRAQHVERLQVRPLTPAERAQFAAAWNKIQLRFVDGPGVAVTDADDLLCEAMSTRGYPPSDYEQRAADISVAYPMVLENYRAAHDCVVRFEHGQAGTEELRQAILHYRKLVEELVGSPELARAASAPFPACAATVPSRETAPAGRLIGVR